MSYRDETLDTLTKALRDAILKELGETVTLQTIEPVHGGCKCVLTAEHVRGVEQYDMQRDCLRFRFDFSWRLKGSPANGSESEPC